MLRITTRKRGNNGHTQYVLELQGRIAGPWTDELRSASQRLLEDRSALTLDLADVRFVDGAGIGLLSHLVRGGAILTGCSPFVAEQLRAAGGLCGNTTGGKS